MTPQEQIAYLRTCGGNKSTVLDNAITAVCDLAERALLDDDERWAAHRRLVGEVSGVTDDYINAVLRRLLGE